MSDQQLSENKTVEHEPDLEWLDDVAGLVSPPDVCIRLYGIVHNPDSTTKEISDVVSLDPNLTARLLRMSNSSFYGFRAKIDTIARSITLVGIDDLYHLVLSVSAVKSFSNIPNDLVSMDTFWKHSVYTGLLARALAKKINVLHPERLFVAGLLHDVGSLVMFHKHPEEMRDLLLIADGDEEALYQAEQEHFGYNHAMLAGKLLADWNLPIELQQAVRWHHDPEKAEVAQLEADILYLANHMVNESDQGNFAGSAIFEHQISGEYLKKAGITEDELFYAFEIAAEQFPATIQALVKS